ncbi:MAG: hypothetical protein M3Y48_19870 [Actinomycetota bacterium]|nr:hypothetical protein [Actinomycetota bacterium]
MSSETQRLSPSVAETEFLVGHIEKLDIATGARTKFVQYSTMLDVLADMLTEPAPSTLVETGNDLAQRLHRTMKATTRATPCILATIVLSQGVSPADRIAILKLDMDVQGARARRQGDVIVSLELLKDLLPQPGRLAKAILWPDPRGGSGAYLQDRNTGEPASYFPNAYDLVLGATPAKAEAALVDVVRAGTSTAARGPALHELDQYKGTVAGALDHLRSLDVIVPPTLPDPLADAEMPVRSQRALRRKVRFDAGWAHLEVPVEHESDVTITPHSDGRWTISVTVTSEPVSRLV